MSRRGGPGVVPRWLETPSAMIPNVTKMKLRQIYRTYDAIIASELFDLNVATGISVCVSICVVCVAQLEISGVALTLV